jgi:hypothetical protein
VKSYEVKTLISSAVGECSTAAPSNFYFKADGTEPATGATLEASKCIGTVGIGTCPSGGPVTAHGQDEFRCEVYESGGEIRVAAVFTDKCGVPGNRELDPVPSDSLDWNAVDGTNVVATYKQSGVLKITVRLASPEAPRG